MLPAEMDELLTTIKQFHNHIISEDYKCKGVLCETCIYYTAGECAPCYIENQLNKISRMIKCVGIKSNRQ